MLPDVCALTRDKSIPDLCRLGVGGGGIGRDCEDDCGSDVNSAGDSGTGDIGVGVDRGCHTTPESLLLPFETFNLSSLGFISAGPSIFFEADLDLDLAGDESDRSNEGK